MVNGSSMNIFNQITVNSSQLEYILSLDKTDLVHYMIEVYDIFRIREQASGIDTESAIYEEDITNEPYFEQWADEKNRVDVMIDDTNILIESNSLKALRIIRNRFVENGFIIQRDAETEKMFKQDKVTRYLRVFRIIGQGDPLCVN